MKLTPSQIKTIELYLLSHELRDRDFYNEMLDHFIVTLENKLDEGEEFDYAFPELTHEFAYFAFKPSWISQEFFGLKGMEAEFINKKVRSSKNNIFGQIVKSFNKVNMTIAFLTLITYYIFYLYYPDRWELRFFAIPQAFLYFVIMGVLIYKDRKRIFLHFRNSLDLSTEELRIKQLGTYDDSFFLMHAILILFSIFSLSKMILVDFVAFEFIALPYLLLSTILIISLFAKVFDLQKCSK